MFSQIQVCSRLWNILSNPLNLDPSCALKSFVSQLQTVCLQCKPGFVLVDRECQTSCPSTHFLHTPTNSCQSKFQVLLILF